jgi:uncharacterized protein
MRRPVALANLQPPSLKAIMPWEGRADQYRDQAYHGGIFAMGFIGNWWLTHTAHHLLGRPRSYNPDAFHNDMLWNMMRNDLDSEYWRMSSARWDASRCRSTASATGGASRCTCAATPKATCARLEAQEAAHPHRHALPSVPFGGRAHGPAALVRLLAEGHRHRHHGRAAGQARDPHRRQHEAVCVPLRERVADRAHAMDEGVPHDRARAHRGGDGCRRHALVRDAPKRVEAHLFGIGRTKAGIASGSSLATTHGNTGRTGVSFETDPMPEDTEITGPLMLNLWVASTSEDMDIFVTIRNIGPDGKDVCEVGQHGSRCRA